MWCGPIRPRQAQLADYDRLLEEAMRDGARHKADKEAVGLQLNAVQQRTADLQACGSLGAGVRVGPTPLRSPLDIFFWLRGAEKK